MSRSIKNGPQLNPGTYTYDATSPHSSYRLSWNNWDTFRSWKNTEEEKGFNFTLAKREKRSSEKGWLWKKKFVDIAGDEKTAIKYRTAIYLGASSVAESVGNPA